MNTTVRNPYHLLLALQLVLYAFVPAAFAESLIPDSVTPASRYSDAPSWELGTIFRAGLPGNITEVRVFSLAEESGDHQVRIWRNSDNALIAGPITWTFGGDEAWISLDIPDVAIEAEQDYTVSVSTTAEGWYPANGAYFASAGNNGLNLSYPPAAGVFSDTAGLRPTSSFGNAAYLRDVVYEVDLSGTIMKVRWNGAEIADGALTPSYDNGTRLGGKGLNDGAREQSFTIENIGAADLQLSGTPLVTLSGPQAADFSVTAQPDALVPGGGSTTFTVKFDPSAIGPRAATISIAHADSPAKPYQFSIQAAGLGGGSGVLGNDSDGAFARNIDSGQIHGNRFHAPSNMRITSLHARVLELVGTFKCAVYSDADGFPDRLLQGSEEVIDAVNGWNTFPLTAPLDVTAGDAYWLVIWSDTTGARVQVDPVGHAYQGSYSYSGLAGEWPDPISLPSLITSEPRTYCIYAEGTPLGVGPGAEIDVRGNDKLIVSGDVTPSVLDGTDFGNLNVAGGSQDQTFTVQSLGALALDLGAAPRVTIVGAQAADFTVTAQPASSIAPGASSSFGIRFDPSVRGLRTATVRIANNDSDESPYEFAIQGAGFSTGRESIFPDSKIGRDIDFDGTYYELGTIFRAAVPGTITHLRVYSLATESGDHTARLWRNDTEEVIGGPYTWNYGGTAGWIVLDIPDVEIEADVDYTVSVSTGTSPKRNYPNLPDLSADGNNGQNLYYFMDAGVFTETHDARPRNSFNHGDYLRDVIFVPAGTVIDLPDMDVQGAGGQIVDGDSTPSTVDGTDFGQALSGGGSVQHTFTIGNLGTAPLNLSSTPKVELSGPQAGDFSVVVQPGAVITPAGQSVFTIRFSPTAAGVRSARVSIDNDSDESPYDFAITGLGIDPATQLRIVEVTSDATSGDVTLRWQGGDPQFQVEKGSTVNGPFSPLGVPQLGRVFTDAGALKAGVRAFYRVSQVEAPSPCSTASVPETWVNTSFASQSGGFTAQFEATPSVSLIDSVMGLSSGPGSAFSQFACLIRFNTSGNIDARNGGAYVADNVIPYSGGVKYSFRVVVDVPSHTYSVYVTPAGGNELTVGASFAFRLEQGSVTSLDSAGVVMTAVGAAGSTSLCNFKLLP